MTKYERKKKRKEMRRAEADQEREEKLKSIKKQTPKKRPTNYRKDSQGNIILFGHIKFSKMSWVVLGAIGLIGLYFFIGVNFGEMDGYVEPEFSFEMCEAQDFTPDMCKFHYKFCREYADGKSICQFAETDPFVNVDPNERYYTPEEQDFMPPQFIAPLVQWADARGDDEPACYSQACKVDNPDLVDGDKEKEVDVKTAKKNVDDVKQEIRDLIKRINKDELEKAKWKNAVFKTERILDEAQDILKEKKDAFRHATDIRVQNQDDIDFQKNAKKELDIAQKNYNKAKSDYSKAVNDYDSFVKNALDNKNNLKLAEAKLTDYLEELDVAKVKSNKFETDNKFVNIVLSKTCTTLIENQLETDCPTYRELRDTYDNTIPKISGEWVDLGYDVKREDPKYKNHWNYYRSLPSWKIITVDPDPQMIERGVTITIQATPFTYLENIKHENKNRSYNSTGTERYEWHNVKYHDSCRSVMIAPDMELLAEVISNIWNDCEPVEPEVIQLEKTPLDYIESAHHQYFRWLQNMIERCTEKC